MQEVKRKSSMTKLILKNVSALFLLQVFAYTLPVITTPYLVRILGTEQYGVMAFASSFATFFHIIVIYGFNLSASREVSRFRHDINRISEIFVTVTLIRLLLLLFSVILLCLISLSIPRFKGNFLLFLWAFLAGAGALFSPVWFFQGIERMSHITLFDFCSKLLTLLLYLLLIRSPQDTLRVFQIGTFCSWLVALASLIFIKIFFRIRLVKPTLDFFLVTVKQGFHIFIAQSAGLLFSNSNIFILGLFTNNKVVGGYAIAEKIVRAAISLTIPLSNAVYPRVSILMNESLQKGLKFLQKILIIGSIGFGILCIAVFVFGDWVVFFISGSKNSAITLCVRILSILPLSIFIDNIFGTQIMLNINMEKDVMHYAIVAGVVSLAMQLVLVPYIQMYGTALSWLFSELLILILFYIKIRKQGISFFLTYRKSAS